MSDKLIKYGVVGLGNFGPQFYQTRHNLGVMALDAIYSVLKKDYQFSDWRERKNLKLILTRGRIAENEVYLAKTLTYMNESGLPIKNLVKKFKIKPANLIVIHDDIDLPLGKIKISFGRASAGHRGVKSVIGVLGTKNFIRMRLGTAPYKKPENVEKFVLEKFTRKEKELLKELLPEAAVALQTMVEEGLPKATSLFN